MVTRLSVIIPTLGRPTLQRAVNSALREMPPTDELIIVGDGPTPGADWVKEYDPRIRYFEHGPTRSWGAAQYDFGMQMAEGHYCVFLPDDDYMPTGALEAIREGVTPYVACVHVFACRMDHWGGRVLRGSKNMCEVTANQIVVPAPNSREGIIEQVVSKPMPHWADSKAQTFDHAYLMAMLKWYDQENPVFHPEVICIADQHNNGRVF